MPQSVGVGQISLAAGSRSRMGKFALKAVENGHFAYEKSLVAYSRRRSGILALIALNVRSMQNALCGTHSTSQEHDTTRYIQTSRFVVQSVTVVPAR